MLLLFAQEEVQPPDAHWIEGTDELVQHLHEASSPHGWRLRVRSRTDLPLQICVDRVEKGGVDCIQGIFVQSRHLVEGLVLFPPPLKLCD